MAEEDKFDVAVIGAGPAGLMAACSAMQQGLSVALIEKNSVPGKKLLLTGNGRCNLTNAEFDLRELVKNYNNGEFLFHAFSVFGPKEAINFFEELGLKTKIETNKRVFPKSDNGREVLDILCRCLKNKKVKIIFDSEITDVNFKNKKIGGLILKRLGENIEIKAKNYIICTGGKSFPLTGSNGFGYELAEKLGHTIVKLSPALVPITAKEDWVKGLQGVNLKDIKISVFQNKKKYFQKEGEAIFTHFGLSGPTILNASGIIGNLLEKGDVKLSIDLFPLLNPEELRTGLEDMLRKHHNKTVKNILLAFVPERLAEVLLDVAAIDKNKIANNMSKIERESMIKMLKNIEITVEGVLGIDQAIVTRGGICLEEIDHKTMRSKIVDNLFFAGEIINVDGWSGGFNLQMCWSTGYIAGKSCKK